MSIEAYYVNYLQLLAMRHNWPQVAEASAALSDAMRDGELTQIEGALAQLEQSLITNPPEGPQQNLRQAQEQFSVLRRLRVARHTGAAFA